MRSLKTERSQAQTPVSSGAATARAALDLEDFPARLLSILELEEARVRGDNDRDRYACALAASIGQEIGLLRHGNCSRRPDYFGPAVHPDGVPWRYTRAEMRDGWCEIRDEEGRGRFAVLMAGPDKQVNRELSRVHNRAALEALVERHFDQAASIEEQRERHSPRLKALSDDQLFQECCQSTAGAPQKIFDPSGPRPEETKAGAAKSAAIEEGLSSRVERLAQEALADDGAVARRFLAKYGEYRLSRSSWRHPLDKINVLWKVLTWRRGKLEVVAKQWNEMIKEILSTPQSRPKFALDLLIIREELAEEARKNSSSGAAED